MKYERTIDQHTLFSYQFNITLYITKSTMYTTIRYLATTEGNCTFDNFLFNDTEIIEVCIFHYPHTHMP